MSENELNKLLLKQVQKKFGRVEDLPENMHELLRAISQSYEHYERERDLMERSMDLSSQEMIESNEQLARQTQQLARSNEELKEFAYIVSHDLKGPLRTIASYVQLIEMRLQEKLDAETREFMDFAISGVKRMQSMLQAMLSYAQVEGEQKNFARVKLPEVISNATENLLEAIERNNVYVHYSPELPEVYGNKMQLVQLFQNLISNSIKFRSERDPVIDITCKSDKGWHHIIVQDNGIGLQSEYAKDVFVMFKRAHNDQAIEGIGMGLSICKKIVEHHNGRISIDSHYTGGLRVGITFPRTQP